MVRFFSKILKPFFKVMDFLTPIVDLLARLWVAKIFFMAGLSKFDSWDSTLALFQYEYHVPFLSTTIAAYIGTYAELILPALLVLGLGGRLAIFSFFVYNLVAMWSYPHLWTPEGALGLDQHINWGLLLAMLMCHGSGKLSIDYWLRKRHGHHLKA